MTKITKLQVVHLSNLTNIKLTEDQISKYIISIESIVSYMRQISDLKIKKGQKISRVSSKHNVWREDVIKPSLSQKQALQNAKKTYKGFFVTDYLLTGKS